MLADIHGHRVDYADLYFQYSRLEGWSLEEGIVKSGSFSIDRGVGVRAVSGEKTAFAYSDDISLDALAQAASATRAIARQGQSAIAAVERVGNARALYAARDPYGLRPLSIGKLPNGYCVASETCALDIVGATFIRDVEPGELIRIDDRGPRSASFAESPRKALCIFEFVYLARADSRIQGTTVHEVRRKLGRRLAVEAPTQADMVIPVPDTGHSAAQGYAEVSGIPYGEGLMKNRYVGRTFIQPSQSLRERGVKLKLNPIPDAIRGKRLVVIDDSIVRGTTTRQIVQALREAGAAEVHTRITCPPIKWPCFYGIDMPTRHELVASDLSVEEIRRFVGADSLGYLSLDGMVAATGAPKDDFCRACFDGEYPIEVPEGAGKFLLEQPARS